MMSTAPTGALLPGSSSFNQFRVTQFVDSNPKPSRGTAASPLSRTTSTQSVELVSMNPAKTSGGNAENGAPSQATSHTLDFSQSLLPSPQPSIVSPPVVEITSNSHIASTAAKNSSKHASQGFSILELAPAPSRDGKLGPHRDGRVRNPVPRKLKGKTDDRNGEFAVMHMDMSGTTGNHHIPRAEAAQRTSENTANAAKTAQEDGYKAFRRPKMLPPKIVAGTGEGSSSPFAPGPSVAREEGEETEMVNPGPRTRILTAEEIKYEQARLLTLLRSINPLTVVDQVCKALAFFGGIPGAPPPDDGAFPQSAEANGTGGLFVGWLSEIFPELERKGWKSERTEVREELRNKRPRGRPRGSKASKARKDKGIKKGPKTLGQPNEHGHASSSLPDLQPSFGQNGGVEDGDDEWEDLEGDSRMDKIFSPNRENAAASNNARMNMQNFNQERSVIPDSQEFESPVLGEDFGSTRSPASANMSKRRPGRPKGSRNRPKDGEQDGTGDEGLLATPIRQPQIDVNSPATDGKKKGRPQGAKTKPKINETVAPMTNTLNTINNSVPAKPPAPYSNNIQAPVVNRRPMQTAKAIPIGPGPPDTTSSIIANNVASTSTVLHTPEPKSGANPATGEKRKRPRPKTTPTPKDFPSTSAQAHPPEVPGSSISNHAIPPQSRPTPPVSTNIAIPETPILPPPKRQRKSKDPSAPPPKKKSIQNVEVPAPAPPVSQPQVQVPVSKPMPQAVMTPAMIVSDAVVSTSRPTTARPPSTRPQAQGLEAHYEHFQSLQQLDSQPLAQHDSNNLSQNSLTQNNLTQTNIRVSPILNTSNFYQQPHQQPQQHPQQQQQQQQQLPRHVTSTYGQNFPSHQTSNLAYSTASTASTVQNNNYRHTSTAQQHPTLSQSFSTRQQQGNQQQQQTAQTHQQFSPFGDSPAYIDLPALESVANGTAAYGHNSHNTHATHHNSHNTHSGHSSHSSHQSSHQSHGHPNHNTHNSNHTSGLNLSRSTSAANAHSEFGGMGVAGIGSRISSSINGSLGSGLPLGAGLGSVSSGINGALGGSYNAILGENEIRERLLRDIGGSAGRR